MLESIYNTDKKDKIKEKIIIIKSGLKSNGVRRIESEKKKKTRAKNTKGWNGAENSKEINWAGQQEEYKQ